MNQAVEDSSSGLSFTHPRTFTLSRLRRSEKPSSIFFAQLYDPIFRDPGNTERAHILA